MVLPELREPVPVDHIDAQLLTALAADSRLSQRRLAGIVGMSPPAVADRLARLEREGVLRRYTVDIDWALLGYSVLVYLGVEVVQGADIGVVMAALRDMSEVTEVSLVTGGSDFLLKVRVRNHDHLRRMLFSVWQIDGVARTDTMLSLGTGGEGEPATFASQALSELTIQPPTSAT